MKYPNDMDPECIPICNALNAIPGIRTTESCYGHGREPFRVFFRLVDRRKVRYLSVVARAFSRNYGVPPGWSCTLHNSDVPRTTPTFMVCSGPTVGNQAYRDSGYIASNIMGSLKHKAFCRMFLGTYPVLESKRSNRKSCDTCGAPCNRAVKQKPCLRWSPLTSMRT